MSQFYKWPQGGSNSPVSISCCVSQVLAPSGGDNGTMQTHYIRDLGGRYWGRRLGVGCPVVLQPQSQGSGPWPFIKVTRVTLITAGHLRGCLWGAVSATEVSWPLMLEDNRGLERKGFRGKTGARRGSSGGGRERAHAAPHLKGQVEEYAGSVIEDRTQASTHGILLRQLPEC